jgi:hypothetical protein
MSHDFLKIDFTSETLISAISTRASVDVIMLYVAEMVANQRGVSRDEIYHEMLATKNKQVDEIIDSTTKYLTP